MATPSEKLANSLGVLSELQADGRRIFKSDELTRLHRERLQLNGFLQPVIKGWVMSVSPDTRPGDSTPWYSSFWEFCARYCHDRFGTHWHLSPQLSLQLLSEASTIPTQVVVYTPRGANNTIQLLFGTSLYDLGTASMPPDDELVDHLGLKLFNAATALVKVPESFFVQHGVTAQVALGRIQNTSDVLRPLLAGGHSAVAGRLAGAFRRLGRPEVAEEISGAMTRLGYSIRETDPFTPKQRVGPVHTGAAPIVQRVETLWMSLRTDVMGVFPESPGVPEESSDYLGLVDDIYQRDAYHSLSMEGYSVTPELIERVRSGDWDPVHRREDREAHDALAARGYWQAFQAVKSSVADVLQGDNAGLVVRRAHRNWYRDLFQPFVAAGVLGPQDLAGYRGSPVYIRGSRHVPSRAETMGEAMTALFDLLEQEEESSVRAVLGHWMVGYIHPFSDGNGRVARFLMNVMLASGGFPWTVIPVSDRDEYLSALEVASVDHDITPFASFVASRVHWSDGMLED